MQSLDFTTNLIKGRIVETIFEQMVRETGNFTVIPFGYEHTMPTLSQYRNISEVPRVLDNIADAPDFALISEDKTKIFLIEVKYQQKLDMDLLVEYSERLLKRWETPWLFVATPEGFYSSPCNHIINHKTISKLSDNWVKLENQRANLEILNKFII